MPRISPDLLRHLCLFLCCVAVNNIGHSEEMPSYGEQLAQWQDSDLDLAASITAAQGVFTAMDQVLDHAFREQDPVPSSDELQAAFPLASAQEARDLQAWLGEVVERHQREQAGTAVPMELLRLTMHLDLFTHLLSANHEPSVGEVLHMMAQHLHLPVAPLPPPVQEAAFNLLQQVAATYPKAATFRWPGASDDEEAETWSLVVGPRAQENLVKAIGRQRFQEVLRSLSAQDLTWNMDFRGMSTTLLERRLMIRIDPSGQRVVLEEALINLRPRPTPEQPPRE